MTLNEVEAVFLKELTSIYPQEEIKSILRLLCEDLLHWSGSKILLNHRTPLNNLELTILKSSLKQLKEYKPVQHITGIAHFYGHQFAVNSDTLIPRQETEELVSMVITENKKRDDLKILDIGTGTGCIGISLKLSMPQHNITLLDVSRKALKIAKKNASNLKASVTFSENDILNLEDLDAKYDVIVSNPPYVREQEKIEIHRNVKNYEPSLALFVEDDEPLKFYKKILELGKTRLKPSGLIYLEINQYLGNEMEALATSLGYTSAIRKDLNGNDRMMKCWL